MTTKLNILDIEQGLESLSTKNVTPSQLGLELLLFFSSANTVKRITATKTSLSDLPDGTLWKEKFHYAPSAPGNVDVTLTKLKQSQQSNKGKVRLLIAFDGHSILVYDRKYDELTQTTLAGLKNEPQLFLPLIGEEGFRQSDESKVDIKATAKLAKLYDAIVEHSEQWLIGDKRHLMNHFMTQIIFCFFAEDTGIFPLDIFTRTIKNRAGREGHDATSVIETIFNALDKPQEQRKDAPAWLAEFPYVNGGLFSGEAQVPPLSPKAYRYLLEAASLDWKYVNPDILGSSIQAIVDPELRGDLGMHYTSVPNILKLLDPLFLDDLRQQLFNARHSKKKIDEFLVRLSKVVIFDAAAGSGNFLVIAYRELRKLELQAMDALRDLNQGASMSFGFTSVVSLNQLYGIEYADFAAETAKLALWIAEYQQNARFAAAFGTSIPALPLRDSGNILCGNALRQDWSAFCPIKEGYEHYIVGNPPYLGSTKMGKEQKEDMAIVFKSHTSSFKTLDYVCAWFLKAAEYCQGKNASCSFVATNSIVQGGHVPLLWPLIFGKGLEIGYAYTSFKWKNNASNNAGVTCVIIGIRNQSGHPKYIFSGDDKKVASNVNGYLLDASNIEVRKSSFPLFGLPSMDYGNKPVDGGNLILSSSESNALTSLYPNAIKFIKKFVGSQELIKGLDRYCLWIQSDQLDEAMSVQPIRSRIEACKAMRLSSPDIGANNLALRPHQFREFSCSDKNTIAIPRVSSENREYLPVDVLTQGEIISDRNFGIYDGPLWAMALIASKMHHIWIATVCVRLEERFSYSNTIGWNTFAVPDLTDEQKEQLNQSARAIILKREEHFPKTIADLYDPKKMPKDLLEVHQANDQLIDSLYREQPFADQNERLAHLFELYIKKTQGK
ncbi:MAG: lactate dehydrogenase [Rheinheimera sp.]|nr:lactate dehydrogenase [Rheinheimera sp.]|tara:strand:- start:55910 stop:58588 length:2679 start_codon:yes stop_codon:yes gene_type:complete